MPTARIKEVLKLRAGIGVQLTERDPTVPAWAKKPEKPTYTAAEVGALSADDMDKIVSAVLTAIPAGDEVAY